MLVIDPRIKFVIGVLITVAIGISSGALVLTNAIPDAWIKPVTAWCGVIAFIGSAIQTTLQGFGTTAQSRISAAASLPEVHQIVATPEAANAAPSDKVVSKP